MRLDDLLRDREPEPGMCPELLAEWPLRVEAVENRRQLFFGNTRSLIFDGDDNRPAVMPRGQPDFAKRWAERHRIPDDVAEHLGQSRFNPGHDEFAVTFSDREHQTRCAVSPSRLMYLGQRTQHRRNVYRFQFKASEFRVESRGVRDIGD